MKNPTWNRDELILALDLYFSLGYGQMHGRNPKVHKLSQMLTEMNEENGFARSVNSVPLKLANFKRFDPAYKGKGMKAGSKLEKDIWNEFSHDKDHLTETSQKIKAGILKKTVGKRKKQFTSWLEKTGKSDGSLYKKKAIKAYVSQIRKYIPSELSLDLAEETGLFGVFKFAELQQVEKSLREDGDSKRRTDMRSALRNYMRFVKDKTELNDSELLPEEFSSRTEGGRKVYVSQRRERDTGLRNRAITIHKTSCQACGFNFGQKYGEWGEGFIEVHHLVPLGGKQAIERDTDPEKDLIVLCANCHRMVHRRKNTVLSLGELKKKIQAAKVE